MAVRLGVVNVDKMLRSLTAKQFAEWEAYALLEPFGEEREDWRSASVRQMIFNMAVAVKDRLDIEHFVLPFGEQKAKKKQTPEEQLRIFSAIAMAYSVDAKDLT